MRIKPFLLVLVLLFVIAVQGQESLITDEATGQQYRIETYVAANFPVGMAFAPDGRLFYNEKTTGNVRVVLADGSLQSEAVVNLPTDALQERGMLGLALSPSFEEDNILYVVHTIIGDARDYPANRLVRFSIDENNLAGEIEELYSVPIVSGELLHNGGNVHFDEQGYLYLSIGDNGDDRNAQNLENPRGKLHRFEVTETALAIPADNPFENSTVYAYGFRNPFDFTFDPYGDSIFLAEVGPDCDDEINVVFAGANYGWHEDYECAGYDLLPFPHYVAPILSYTPAITPTGIVIYDGEAFPAWQGNLLFCDWNNGVLHRIVLDESRTKTSEVHEIDLGEQTCKLDLVISPDGSLYFGTVGNGGGEILRLIPAG
jgi:glucose/arabinose dehydrogenase